MTFCDQLTEAARVADCRDMACGPFEVFNPVSGAVVLVTDDPQDAADFAGRWGLDWSPAGEGY
jgi:hypothetical protein